MALPSDWDSYRQSLSRNRREAIGRKRRRFAQESGARFSRVDAKEQIDPAFDRLAELHRLRWQDRTDSPSFTSPQYLGLHRDMMHALFARGRLRLYALDRAGASIAMFYGFRKGGDFYYFQAGFDPAYAALSPGEVLMGYVIEAAIAEGCTRFDKLKGDYGHKRHFFQQTRETTGLRVHRPGLVCRLYRLKDWLGERRATAAQASTTSAAAQEAEGVGT